LGLVVVQLGFVLLVVWRYQLESRTFFNVLALGCAGFCIHALLPLRFRLGMFVALSLTGIVLAFGLVDGLWLVLLGLVLIGICHLPLRLALRVALLLLTGGLFALFRVEAVQGPWSSLIWPILGSMFMFRLALYLHALQHDEQRPTATRTLAYFFMLPNVCFPLFPVVDYLSFKRNYYDREAIQIYETGVKWIVRGLIQLVLYRFVYAHLAGDATNLNSLGELVQFLLSTFLLYLRVSGQFHVICGFLYLFGFRLPETHHLYFLASSFTDFWRRINIYWKDFMMKLVYYPSFFRLKKYGLNNALVGATIVVFLGTWLLHSYQWFWLRGGFPLEPQDGLFWGILGALVVIGALREMKRSRPQKLGSKPAGWSLGLAWRTVLTFCAICLLWSLWSAESLMSWLLMWRAASTTSARELLVICALIALGVAIAGHPWKNLDAGTAPSASGWRWLSLVPVGGLVGLLFLSAKDLYVDKAPKLARVVATLQQTTLNDRDAKLQQKGYYENLDNQSRMSAQLWEVVAKRPAHWVSLGESGAYRERGDFLSGELRPNLKIVFNDQPLSTNSSGMRDREWPLAKAPGTFRIAVLGPSHVMGSGVADGDTFTRRLEERLNTGQGAPRVEVLNFGVAAYALTQQLAALDQRVMLFGPDVVVFTDSPKLLEPVVKHLALSIATHRPSRHVQLDRALRQSGALALGDEGIAVPFDSLRSLSAHLGIRTRMPWTEAEQRLRRDGHALLRATFDSLVAVVRMIGAVRVFLALDNVGEPPAHAVSALAEAASAGMVVLNLLDVWQGRESGPLRVAPWDAHPNAAGNGVIADRLARDIRRRAPELRLKLDLPATPQEAAR
jgi:D-alanyl-lipoteichoic acid acyltransferase DltB (MBOAT superfamily)